MGETDEIIGTAPPDPGAVIPHDDGKLRICRTPGCLITFDPKWRVRLTGEPGECELLCPRCGADLTRNSFIRRAGDEVSIPQEER
jgi:hypothetical protein